jgi:hypothetical protein
MRSLEDELENPSADDMFEHFFLEVNGVVDVSTVQYNPL